MPLHPVDGAKLKTSGASTGSGPELRRLVKKTHGRVAARSANHLIWTFQQVDGITVPVGLEPAAIGLKRFPEPEPDAPISLPNDIGFDAGPFVRQYQQNPTATAQHAIAQPFRTCVLVEDDRSARRGHVLDAGAQPIVHVTEAEKRRKAAVTPRRTFILRQGLLRSHHLTVQSQDI
jgi:hypothetical protein